ncbi:MAG: hypothetical protein JWN78_396 [Bacteroidota bacterium]|nr:hypothetical protein [Bacteroidota bacterium]
MGEDNNIPEVPVVSTYNSLFDSISQQVANNSPFGTNSGFYIIPSLNKEDFKGEFYYDVIDFDMLAKDLKDKLLSRKIQFDYSIYTSKLTKIVENSDPEEMPSSEEKKSKPFTYYKDKTVASAYFLGSRLNTLQWYLDGAIYSEVFYKDDLITYGLTFPFHGTQDYRKEPATGTESPTDVTYDDRFDAIILKSTSIEDIQRFYKFIRGAADTEAIKKNIVSRFNDFFKKANGNAAQLKYLYEQAPDFVLLARDKEALWNDLLLLINYDDKGTFSFLKDASTPVIKILQGIDDLGFLYDKFSDNSGKTDKNGNEMGAKLIKRIYEDLNGESEYEGSVTSNKIVFTSVLTTICWANFDKLAFSGATFRVGKDDSEVDYKVDSNLRESKDRYPDQIFLRQGYIGPYDGRTFYMHEYKENYDPLEMVTLITYDEEYNEIPVLVSAIYLKAIADQEEWKRIMFYVRVGFDIILAAVSIATLVTGPQFLLFAISLVDFGLATKDIQMAMDESELMKTPSGREYVKTWNKIYMLGGIATAAPLLLRTALNLGAKLLETLTVANARNFVISLMIRVITEKNILFKKLTIEFLENGEKVYQVSNRLLAIAPINRLYKVGVRIFRGVNAAEKIESFFVLYRGEIISFGLPKKLREDLQYALKAFGEKDIIKFLDELWARVPKLTDDGKYWTCTNDAKSELRWDNLKGVNRILRDEKSIQAHIEVLSRGTAANKWVSAVADELRKIDKLTDINNIVNNLSSKQIAGDFDVASNKFLIECKESITKNLDTPEFRDQMDKYLNPKNKNFINLKDKKVVLAIGKYDDIRTLSHPFLKELEKNGVQIVTNINQIKKLKP